tara:strand:- start:702 stop:1469 length:768 start_codon:yes stop_codon:yes gene_type:complete
MKIAFCIAGLFKPSTTHSTAYQNKFAYLTEKIKAYNADTFICSFSKEIESEVVDIFKPKSFEFRVQEEFSDKISNINSILDKGAAKRVFSLFYSRKRACELRKEFEEANNIKYDAVVLCRPDLGYVYTENFQIPDLHEIDTNYLYTMHWNQLNAGMADWFFISNPKNVDFVSDIYDRLPLYLQKNSAYQKSLTAGFPYSNSENRFSQEIFKENPQHSERIAEIHMLNQHCLVKHHLLANDRFSLEFLKFANQPHG